jgi:hypothetical protein
MLSVSITQSFFLKSWGRRNILVADPPTPDDRRRYHSLVDMWYSRKFLSMAVFRVSAYIQQCSNVPWTMRA